MFSTIEHHKIQYVFLLLETQNYIHYLILRIIFVI